MRDHMTNGLVPKGHRYPALRLASLLLSLALGLFLVGCPAAGGGSGGNGDEQQNDNMPDDGNDDPADGGDDDGGDDGGDGDDGDDGGSGLPFGTITGTELFVEGTRSALDNGETDQRDERFTATWTLTPTTAEESEVFINDVLTVAIRGDISGEGHLTYEESENSFTPELVCPMDMSAGSVEWDAEVVGSYQYVPLLGTITLTTHATNVSSPEYSVTYTNPGCPENDSVSPSQYVWQGPGQGAWGFVDIVLENGHYENRLENPNQDDDRGDEDFYEIEANVGSAP